MLRIRALVSLFVLLGLIATTGGGLRGSAALAATAITPTRSFASPYNVQGLAYGGGSLWAATPSAYDPATGGYTGIVSELDPATGAVRRTFPLPGLATGLTHDGTYLYATQSEARAWCDAGVSRTTPGTIAVIDPATGQVVRTIPSPITGGQGGLGVVNGELFAVGTVNVDPCANNQSGSYLGGGGLLIVGINPATGALLGYRNVDALGISPRELDANGTNLVYASTSSAGLTVYTLAPTLTGEVLRTDVLAVPTSSFGGVDVNGLAASGTELYVADRADGKIYVFPTDGTNLSPAPARSFASPVNVQGLAYGGGSLWATTSSAYDPATGGYTGIVSELDPATGTVRKSFPFPTIATGLTHDGTYLYATRDAGTLQCGGINPNTIAVIDPATGQIVRSIPSPITGGNGGLAALNGRLFAVGALNLDPCANSGQGMSVGVVIAEVNPANGALLAYTPVNSLGISPRELAANGTNLVYASASSAGLAAYTLAPTLTGEVLRTDVLTIPLGYRGSVDVNGLAASGTELYVADRADGKIYVFPSSLPVVAAVPPVIAGLNPASITANDPTFTSLTVDGTGFDQGATVLWNGSPLSTTLVAPGRLAATVPPASIPAAGTAELIVRNGDGQRSTPRAFFITETAAAVVGASSGTSTSSTGTATTTSGGSTATATGSGTITLAQYVGNPVVTAPPTATVGYFDVHVASGSAFSAISVQDCTLGGGDTVYWYNATATPPAWEPVSGQRYDLVTRCITLTLTAASSPSVTQLTRTEFAVMKAAQFLAPLKAGTINSFKVGSTIPVKLAGPTPGRKVTLQILPGDQTAVQETGTTSIPTSNQAADSANQFRYDSGCGCYIYNLSTKSGFAAGSSYTLVALVDGQRAAAILIFGTK